MTPALLERRSELEALDAAADRATSGRGGCAALICGEAGIGKTSLVKAFVAGQAERLRLLAGACEDLLMPRALGPLRDATRSTNGPLRDALASAGDLDRVFAAVSEQLRSRPATVLVVEDAQWADSATLDVLRYAGRRVHELGSILVVTYRDDELTREHPLRAVLGSIAGPARVAPEAGTLDAGCRREPRCQRSGGCRRGVSADSGKPVLRDRGSCGDRRQRPADRGRRRPVQGDEAERSGADRPGHPRRLALGDAPRAAASHAVRPVTGRRGRAGRACSSCAQTSSASATSWPAERSCSRCRRAPDTRSTGSCSRPSETAPTPTRSAFCTMRSRPVTTRRLSPPGWPLAAKRAGSARMRRRSRHTAPCWSGAPCSTRRVARPVSEAYSWALANSNRLHDAVQAAVVAVDQWRLVGDDVGAGPGPGDPVEAAVADRSDQPPQGSRPSRR